MAKKKYKCGGKMKKAGGSIYEDGGFLQTDLSPYAQIGGMAGNVLGQTNTPVGTIGGGALKGAAAGAALGPLGAIGGALIGGIGGVFKNKAQEEAEAEAMRLANAQAVRNDVGAFQGANKMYAQGGSLNQDANITQYNGYPHDFGGLPLTEGIEVEHNETRGVGNTEDYIFSDSLKVDEKKNKTFADISKEIDKKYKGYENDKFAIKNKDKELSELMFEQEALKDRKYQQDLAQLQINHPDRFPTHTMPDGTEMAGATHNQAEGMYKMGGMLNTLGGTIDPPKDKDPKKKKTATNTEAAEEWVPGEADFERVLGKPEFTSEEDVIAWNDMMEKQYGTTRAVPFHDLKPAMAKYAEKWNIGAQDLLAKVQAQNPDVDFMSDLQKQKKELLSQGMKYDEMTENLAKYAIENYGDIYSKKADLYGNLRPRDKAYYDRAEQMLRTRGGLRHTPGVDPRNTARASGAGKVDVDDSDFGWRNLISPQFIQPTEQFKSIWNPGETIQQTLTSSKKYGGNIYLNGGGIDGIATLQQMRQQELQNPKIFDPTQQNTNPIQPTNNIYADQGILGNMQVVPPGQQMDEATRLKYMNATPEDLTSEEQRKIAMGDDYIHSDYEKNPTMLKNQVTGGAYNIDLSPLSKTPINYYGPGNRVGEEKYNKAFFQKTGQGFSPESAQATMDELGINPEYSQALSSDPKLMQDYFDYVERFAEQSPENYQSIQNLIKQRQPNFNLGQGIGDKDRFGQHHQWMLDPYLIERFMGERENIPLAPPIGDTPQVVSGGLDDGTPNLSGVTPPGLQEQPGLEGGEGNVKRFRPDLLGSVISTLPNVGMGIGNLSLANRLELQRTSPTLAEADYVDPTRAIQEVRDQYAGAKDVARQVSSGSGNLMSNLIGATAGQAKATSGVQSQYDQINAQISNQFEQFNVGQKQRAKDINTQIANQETQMKTNLRQQGYEGLMGGLAGGITTYYDSKKYADQMNMAGGENFYYRSVGPSFNQTPVKVFRGNGYHYYEDPNTGAVKFIHSTNGKEVKDPKKLEEYNKDLTKSKTSNTK